MQIDQITRDDVETTKFHESPYSENCAIRTLRRMLGKARDWKAIHEVPRIKTVKVFPRETAFDARRDEAHSRLPAACACLATSFKGKVLGKMTCASVFSGVPMGAHGLLLALASQLLFHRVRIF